MDTLLNDSVDSIHSSWISILRTALATMNPHYLSQLAQTANWLPGKKNIFKAFSLPLANTHYILFGESPYPRQISANGYAFWDGAVHELWSDAGLSKQVNRATSLRHLVKMLLIADGALTASDTSQHAISMINKDKYVTTIDELFNNLLHHGFLLLNTSLVLSTQAVKDDALQWKPFMTSLLQQLHQKNRNIQLVLLGKIAQDLNKMNIVTTFKQLVAEHPYNISFIHNQAVINFFRPFKLLNVR